jgi:hypothetical protein
MGQFSVLIFCLVIIGIAMYFWQRNKSKKAIEEGKKDTLGEDLRLENVQAGGLIHLMNVGPNLEEYDVQILSRSVYREGENYEWYELEGDNGRGKVWLSLQHDDGLDVTIATRKLKLRDIPIERDDLDRMDDAAAGQFDFEGQTYYYDHSTEGSYFQNGEVSPDNEEFFYYWEFEAKDESRFLTVEEWENGRFEVTVSYPVKESQVKVYSLGGKANQM